VAANRHADAAPQPSGNRDPALDADVPPDLPVKQRKDVAQHHVARFRWAQIAELPGTREAARAARRDHRDRPAAPHLARLRATRLQAASQEFGMTSDPTAARPVAGTGPDLPHAQPAAADSRGGLEARQAMRGLESVP
jgi:hypothetical protein